VVIKSLLPAIADSPGGRFATWLFDSFISIQPLSLSCIDFLGGNLPTQI
jgi:hypothetical protein